MTYNIEWTHRPIKLTETQQKILDREIANISEELERASDLIFHTVFLTEDMNGAIVIVDSKEGVDDTVYLTYYETPEWMTLDDID